MFRQFGSSPSRVLLVALFSLTALAAGCSDEAGGGNENDAGSGGTTAGSSGKGGGTDPGTGGTGGSGEGGVAQGDAGNDAGGAEAAGGASYGGDGGAEQGGAGGQAPVDFADITEVTDVLVEGVHDLRGLTYAADGKLYASGYRGAQYGSGGTATVPNDREVVVVRFNADGTLDDSFDGASSGNGIVAFNLVERVTTEEEVVTNDGNEDSLGLVELENGDLIVQVHLRAEGGTGQDVGLLKLTDAGLPVEAFGTDRGIDGLRVIDFGWTDEAKATASDTSWGVVLDRSGDDEKVVLNGHGNASNLDGLNRTDTDRYVVRLIAETGELDPTFNYKNVEEVETFGVWTYNSSAKGTFTDNGRRPVVEADGTILSVGYTNFGEGLGNHIMLIRLLPDGTPDPDFGFGIADAGVARANPFLSDGGFAEAYAAAKQESGRYVTTGYGQATVNDTTASEYGWASSKSQDVVSFGVLPNGIDTSFGVEGTLAIQSEEYNLTATEDRGRDVLILPDQRIVQVGRFGDHPAVFVLLPDGQADASVGNGGRFDYDPLAYDDADDLKDTGTSHFYRVALSPDGKTIAATTANHPNGVLLALLELEDE
jgi:uncharacterized delta-60 repeat protein